MTHSQKCIAVAETCGYKVHRGRNSPLWEIWDGQVCLGAVSLLSERGSFDPLGNATQALVALAKAFPNGYSIHVGPSNDYRVEIGRAHV